MTPQESELLDLLVAAYPSPGMLFQRVGFPASEVLQKGSGSEIWHDAFPKLQNSELLGKLVAEVLGSPEVARYHEPIRAAWGALSGSVRLSDADVEDLLAALDRLDTPEDLIIGAFLRAVPAGGFGTDLAERSDRLRALCTSLARRTLGTQVPALLRFANLVNDGRSDDVRDHIERIAKRLGGVSALPWMEALDAERTAPRPASEAVLCFIIRQGQYEETCRAEAWLYAGTEPWWLGAQPFPLGEVLPEDALSWTIRMIERADAITHDTVGVEFVLELDALDVPLERNVKLGKKLLGAARDVKVRSIERFRFGPRRTRIERLWQAQEAPLGLPAVQIDPAGESCEELEERYAEDPPLSVLFVGERPPGAEYVEVVHETGVPIALWRREIAANSAWDSAFACVVGQLPKALKKARRKADPNVVLLWDAPDRAPPAPLRRSARTAEGR